MKRVIFTLSVISSALLFAQSTIAQNSDHLTRQNNKFARIIDGKDAEIGAYPFMTALLRSDLEQISPNCGSSYIGGRYVLTATHCIEGLSANDIDVWIGGHDTTKPNTGQRVKVAQIYAHEAYNGGTLDNDIAILELVEDIQGVTPINLITPELEAELIKDGFEFTIMGWGNLKNDGDREFPTILQEVNVPLATREQCVEAYGSADEGGITDNMICAGFPEGGKDSCQGDSGGPMVFKHDDKWYQAGIVSFGEGCGLAGYPGVYARVSQYNNWIAEKKAGVSYQQYARQGFIEQSYDETIRFNIKNVSQTNYSVTAASVSAKDNVEKAEVSNNECLGKTLSYNDSCDIQVAVKTNMLGANNFTLTVATNNSVNKSADIFFSANSLEKETLDFPTLVGSDANLIEWWGGADAKWQAATDKASQGDSSISSGDISHYETSALIATIDNDRVSEFNFQHLVSSELDYDNFIVLHNGKEVLRRSGTEKTEFETTSIKLSEGRDRINFIYAKDSDDFLAVGDDKAHIDKVTTEFANQAPVAKVQQAEISVQEGQSFTLDASGSSDADGDTITYKWEVTSTAKVAISNPAQAKQTFVAPEYKTAKSLSFKVTTSDEYGASTTATVTVNVTEKPKKSGGSTSIALFALGALALRRLFK